MWTKKQLPIMIAKRHAQLNGFPEYIGSPCPTCGNKLRYTSTSNCMYCTRKRAHDRYHANKAAARVPS